MRVKRCGNLRRKGASTVEFAIVAPIFFLILLGLVQFVSLLMTQNVLTAAAREGGRLASMPSTVSTDAVVSEVEDRLSRGGVNPTLATVSVSPTTLGGLGTGNEVSVSVSVAIQDMGWIWAIAPADLNLSAEITYERE